ncbi:MAG: hypothetical protein IMZ53_00385 [Thermoplasmata archaeon]|nr:hypothetical protein [Thermoplasmata archaeon]
MKETWKRQARKRAQWTQILEGASGRLSPIRRWILKWRILIHKILKIVLDF